MKITFATIRKTLHPTSPTAHLILLWCLALAVMVNWAEGYRVFTYLNFIAVISYAAYHLVRRSDIPYGEILKIIAIPLGFTLLHMAAVSDVDMSKDLRHLWFATFVVFGMWIAGKRGFLYIERHFWPALGWLMIVYTAIQMAGILADFHPYGSGAGDSPYRAISYGVTSNPHYLALYSALGFPAAMYCMAKTAGWLRWSMAGVSAALAYFVLLTSSRPAWLALMAGAFVAFMFLQNRDRLRLAAAAVLIPALLYLGNIGHFGDRLTDLAQNAAAEERVVIWQDTWSMQKASSLPKWIFGHGVGSFKEDFKQYSKYHGEMDFHHPHNTLLEVLYTSGGLGLLLSLLLYMILYFSLLRLSRGHAFHQSEVVLLTALLVIHCFIVMLTVPFFSRYNFYPLAYLGGAVIMMRMRGLPSTL